jgi:hypothetical protein
LPPMSCRGRRACVSSAISGAGRDHLLLKQSDVVVASFGKSGRTWLMVLLSRYRLTPGDPANPESYKVRQAKVGGYRDYFTDTEVAKDQLDRFGLPLAHLWV